MNKKNRFHKPRGRPLAGSAFVLLLRLEPPLYSDSL